jgi:hypothetical protein
MPAPPLCNCFVAVLFSRYSRKYSNLDPLLILFVCACDGQPAVLDWHYLDSGDFD